MPSSSWVLAKDEVINLQQKNGNLPALKQWASFIILNHMQWLDLSVQWGKTFFPAVSEEKQMQSVTWDIATADEFRHDVFKEVAIKHISLLNRMQLNAWSQSLLSSSSTIWHFQLICHFETQQKARQSRYSLSINEKPNRLYSFSFSSLILFSWLRRSKGLADIDLYSSFRMNVFEEGIWELTNRP